MKSKSFNLNRFLLIQRKNFKQSQYKNQLKFSKTKRNLKKEGLLTNKYFQNTKVKNSEELMHRRKWKVKIKFKKPFKILVLKQ